MTPISSSSGLSLALPTVDLPEESHWLAKPTRGSNSVRKAQQLIKQVHHQVNCDRLSNVHAREQPGLHEQKSPYRQTFCRLKPSAPSSQSPAQQAAKSILKLKNELLLLEDTNETRRDTTENDVTTTVALAQRQAIHQAVMRASVSPTSSKSMGSYSPSVGASSPDRTKFLMCRPSQKKKKKKRMPTWQESQLAVKQEHLANWLHANPDGGSDSAVYDARHRHLDEFGSFGSPYSMEVEARIQFALQCRGPLESGVRLWDDPVRSLLAAEMTSEAVFGGATSARALAFQPRDEDLKAVSQSKQLAADEQMIREFTSIENEVNEGSSIKKTELSDHVKDLIDTAHCQAADGAITDALETLEAGIRQSLSSTQVHQDTRSGAWFNYSVLAHKSATILQLWYRARHRKRVKKLVFLQRQWRWWYVRRRMLSFLPYAHKQATKLQLWYRARHRKRVKKLVFLQRQWRWWYARRRMLSFLQHTHKQATVIQRCYRPWHSRINQVRCAVRIQQCFRFSKRQKLLIRFQQVCRLVLARQARCRQLKSRARMIEQLALVLQRYRRRAVLIQNVWRRHYAESQLALQLDQARTVELERRTREDEFVAAKLAQAQLSFRKFLKHTKRGRRVVRQQAERPWWRFCRLYKEKKQWNELPLDEKIDALAGVLPRRTFRGLQLRALCQMLVGKDKQLPPLPKVLKVSRKELAFLTNSCAVLDSAYFVQPIGSCPWWTKVWDKMSRLRALLWRQACILWWTIVMYPKEYFAVSLGFAQTDGREHAQQQLEDDFARVVTAFLRVWFRRLDQKTNIPQYSCEWCCESFGTQDQFVAHDKCATARARAVAEWTALNSDQQFASRKKWRFAKQLNDDFIPVGMQSFDLEAASVRYLRRTRSCREALVPLVATFEACSADKNQTAVLPLDLVGYVLHFLDDDQKSHVTAEYQQISWSPCIGSIKVDRSPRQTPPQGSESNNCWIRHDELRSRLVIASKRPRSNWSRWRRRVAKCRPLLALDMKLWKRRQLYGHPQAFP